MILVEHLEVYHELRILIDIFRLKNFLAEGGKEFQSHTLVSVSVEVDEVAPTKVLSQPSHLIQYSQLPQSLRAKEPYGPNRTLDE